MKLLTIVASFFFVGCNGSANPTLTVEVRGDGSVTSTPAGIDCSGNASPSGENCSAEFPKGSPITLVAKGRDGSSIRFEVGELPPSTEERRVITLEEDMRLTITLTPGVPTTPPPTAPSPFPTPGRGDPGLGRTAPGPGYIDGGPSPATPKTE